MKSKVFCCLMLVFLMLGCSRKITNESWIDTSLHEGLMEIKTDYPFKVLATKSIAKSTDQTLENLSLAKSYFDKIFETDLSFTVLFIENSLWDKHSYFPPPGLPQASRGNVILGLDKSIISQEVERNLLKLPQEVLSPLKKVYGDTLDLDVFYREILSVHELAHLYHFSKGVKSQRKWLQEFFANAAMYAFVKNRCSGCYEKMNTYPEFILKSGDRMAEFKTLQEFETKYVQGMSPPNYEWYQMQFYKKAKIFVDTYGEEPIDKIRHFLIDTDLSKTSYLSDSEFVNSLNAKLGNEISEFLLKWEF